MPSLYTIKEQLNRRPVEEQDANKVLLRAYWCTFCHRIDGIEHPDNQGRTDVSALDATFTSMTPLHPSNQKLWALIYRPLKIHQASDKISLPVER